MPPQDTVPQPRFSLLQPESMCMPGAGSGHSPSCDELGRGIQSRRRRGTNKQIEKASQRLVRYKGQQACQGSVRSTGLYFLLLNVLHALIACGSCTRPQRPVRDLGSSRQCSIRGLGSCRGLATLRGSGAGWWSGMGSIAQVSSAATPRGGGCFQAVCCLRIARSAVQPAPGTLPQAPQVHHSRRRLALQQQRRRSVAGGGGAASTGQLLLRAGAGVLPRFACSQILDLRAQALQGGMEAGP